jgi:transposase
MLGVSKCLTRAGQTHDYERHGTTTLFAALNVLDGTVIGECHPRHHHQEFLGLLAEVDASLEPGFDVHVILANYGTHKHPDVKRWFAARVITFTSRQLGLPG